jgi:hypothetical protein
MLFGFVSHVFRSAFYNYSIMNATHSDFIKVFYPLLSNNGGENEIHRIVQANLSRLKRTRNFNQKILKVCASLIRNGFGSVVFEEYIRQLQQNPESTLSLSDLQKDDYSIARIVSTYLIALIEKDGSNKTNWTNAYEILTIIGQIPIQVHNSTFTITDRHNELIYKMRLFGNTWNAIFNSEKSTQDRFFRRHLMFGEKDTGSMWEEQLNYSWKKLFGLFEANEIHIKNEFFQKNPFNKPSDLLHTVVSDLEQSEVDFSQGLGILRDVLSAQTYEEWQCFDPISESEKALGFIPNIDARKVSTAMRKGNWREYKGLIDEIFNDYERSCKFIQDIRFWKVGNFGWKYAKELIAKNISADDKMQLIGRAVVRNPEVASDVLHCSSLGEIALAGVFHGIIRLANIWRLTADDSERKNVIKDIGTILDCLRDSPIDRFVKASVAHRYDFVNDLIKEISFMSREDISYLFTKLFAIYPFSFRLFSPLNLFIGQNAIQPFSMLDYLPADKRMQCESIMQEWSEFDETDKINTLRMVDYSSADPLFSGYTLLHYAASLKEPPAFLTQLANGIDSFSENNKEDILYIITCGDLNSPLRTVFSIALRFDRQDSISILCQILNKIFKSSTNSTIKARCRQFKSDVLRKVYDSSTRDIIVGETRDISLEDTN